MTANKTLLRLSLVILPILISVVITSVIIVVVGADPRAVFESVFEGAFRNSNSFKTLPSQWRS